MKTKIKLVLSGSGTRFPVFVGALQRLEEAGYEIEEVIGTSGGSIIAAALAGGMNSEELTDLCKTVMPSLKKKVSGSLLRVWNDWGYYDNKALMEEVRKYVPDTFSKVRIPLHIVSVNWDTGKKVIFNKDSTPNLDLARACGASSAIPGAFPPVMIDGDYYIDGGVAANFAIDYFEDSRNVIGICFKDPPARKKRPKGFLAFFEFVARAVTMLIDFKTEDDIEDVKDASYIAVSTSIAGLTFDMKEGDVEKMLHDGYKCADEWVKKQNVR